MPGGEEPLAQHQSLGRGRDAELRAQDLLHPGEASQPLGAVSASYRLSEELDVCLLVDRVEAQHLLPAMRTPQEAQRTQAQPLSRLVQPGFTQVVRKQLTGELECRRAGRRRRRTPGECGLRHRLEDDRIDLDPRAGEQRDELALEHHRVGIIERATCEVRRLVEPRKCGVESDFGPQSIDDAIAVEPPLGRQGKELHQGSALPTAPRLRRDRPASHVDCEAAQQAHLDEHPPHRIGVRHPSAPARSPGWSSAGAPGQSAGSERRSPTGRPTFGKANESAATHHSMTS